LLKGDLRRTWRNTARKEFLLSVRRKATNPRTGRLWNVLDCVDCSRVMGVSEKEKRVKKDGSLEKRAKSVYEVDHVKGITPLVDIQLTLGDYWYDMMYGEMEVVCVKCHKKRTARQTRNRLSLKHK